MSTTTQLTNPPVEILIAEDSPTQAERLQHILGQQGYHVRHAANGRQAMGILLTGMGRDGAAGLRRMREAGGLTIAQDAESSVVFGMPAKAIRMGAAEHALPPIRLRK